MQYIVRTNDDALVIPREEPEDYIFKMLQKAFRDSVNIKILYDDGSSIELNPKEQ
jgi:hypothetical protein